MLKSLFKKRISEDKLANTLVNSLVTAMDKGFPDIAELINNDQDFVINPNIQKDDYDKFLFILFVGNLDIMSKSIDKEYAESIEEKLIAKFSQVFGMEEETILRFVKEYSSYMGRINYPSKNVLYAMSKSVFYKYKLSQYQEAYFKDMNTPKPMFLKRLNDIVENFIWDWDYFLDKYKVD
jgi:hypothetical protein